MLTLVSLVLVILSFIAPVLALGAFAVAAIAVAAMSSPPLFWRSERGGAALELLCGQATAPSSTFTALTMNSGNSLTARNAPLNSMVKILQVWVDSQAVGVFRIRSPKLHDNVQGIRLRHTVSEPVPLLPMGVGVRLIPQDVLVAEITGSATAGDIESAAMLLYYEDLPGSAARLITFEELMRRAVTQVTVENLLSTGTAGGYSGEEAINAEFDLLKANTDYALIGYNVEVEALAIRWRGADTANLGLGGPGIDTAKWLTADWFSRLSKAFGLPLIPVFNAANRSGILMDAHQDENGGDPTVTSILVELGPSTGR